MEKKILDISQFYNRFPSEESARLFFESKRFGNGISCGHCGSSSTSECKDHQPMTYRCKSCRKHFSVRTGTVLSESKLPLQKWLLAIYIMTNKCGNIENKYMAHELGITQKSTSFLVQRIHETWIKHGK